MVSRLCRGDGRLPFTNGEANGICNLWSATAASIAGPRTGSSQALEYLQSLGAASARRNRSRTKSGRANRSLKGPRRRKAVRPVCQSDGSRLACLRDEWISDANLLSVLHHGRFPKLELATRGNVLVRGDWEIEVCVAGRELPLTSPWICSCWYTDDEGDYLELQAHITPETRVERQLLLARNDDLLFLADAIIGGGDVRIDYVSRLPLVSGVEVQPDRRSRECRLVGKARTARVFPLALPCERILGTAGHFSASSSCLELRQSGMGGLYAPLFIDWNPARRRSPAVWRPLTIAQDGAAISSGRAAGYRLQAGKEQWLFYRSLSRILEPRTVLGQHTLYETMIGRFLRSGKFEPMVLVEQRPEDAHEP